MEAADGDGHMPRRIGHRALVIMLSAALIASSGVTARAQTASQEATASAAAGQQVAVRVVQAQPSVTTTGALDADVVTTLSSSAEYFEVRLRLKSADGRLLYQKTEVRHNVSAGEQVIHFGRDLADLGVQPGRYPMEIRVLATGASATEIASRLLVVEGALPPVPVAIIVRLTCSPGVDPSGRFLNDPALDSGARRDAGLLADVISANPGLRLALAISPLQVEEWARAADGYETSGPEGVKSFAADSAGAVASAQALERVKGLLGTGRVELLDVPYAEPDVAGLAAIGALGDITGQWALTDSTIQSALASEVSSGTAFLGDELPAAALPQLEARHASYVVLAPSSVRSGNATAGTGVYRLGSSDVRALVYDSRPVRAAAENNEDLFYDALFERALSSEPSAPVVMRFEIGPGTRDSVAGLERTLEWLSAVPWAHIVGAADAAAFDGAREGSLVQSLAQRGAPVGYWSDVATARMKATAASRALGEKDADARTALSSAYIAESLCWAGPDRGYALADRGRAFAASADRYVDDLFASLTIGAREVTLSNRTGAVPVSIVNGTGKPVKVQVLASAMRASISQPEHTVTLDAGENVVTVPVDMGSALSDTLTIRLASGEMTIRTATVSVHASYLDRLATLGMVVVFLLGLLLFIRRRVRGAGAGTMPEEPAEG